MDLGNGTIEEFSRERLMDDVRQYPCLYDKYSKDYQDKNAKNNAWAAVAVKYGITSLDAERKYKTIRSSFTRYLKRKRHAPPGTRNADGPTPLAFQNLDWLAGHIDHKEMAVKSWAPSMKNDGYFNDYFDNDDAVYRGSYAEMIRDDGATNGDVPLSSAAFACVSPGGSDTTPPPPVSSSTSQQANGRAVSSAIALYYDNKSATKHSDVDSSDNATHEKQSSTALLPAKRKHTATYDEEDEDTLFCMSLAANLKRLTPRSKAIAKMRFQQVLYEVEFPTSRADEDK